ncbi:MAG: alpha/beta hydrolase, partial [Deinococcus sp.]|nr:alpha/beta hydrolase [Deinococcus sp.]
VLLKLLARRGAELPHLARAAVISGPAARVCLRMPRWQLWAGRLCAQVMPTLRFAGSVRPDLLTSDPLVAAAYEPDPLVHRWTSARLGMEILDNGPQVLSSVSRISLPCLLIHGAEDAITDPAGSQEVAARLAGPHALRIYASMRHEPHNERQRELVFRDVEQWAEQYVLSNNPQPAAASEPLRLKAQP